MVLSRSIFVAFRRHPSKINNLIRAPAREESFSTTRFYPNCSKPSFSKSRISVFSLPMFSNPAIQNGFKSIRTPVQESFSTTSSYRNCSKPSFSHQLRTSGFFQPVFSNSEIQSPFLNGTKGFCHVDIGQQTKSKWPIKTLLFSIYILITVTPEVYLNENLETVPFSKRTHLVKMSIESEKKLGQKMEENMLRVYGKKILPSDHPDSIRAQGIAKNIIEALQRRLEIEKGRMETEARYSPASVGSPPIARSLENNWIQKSKEEGRVKGTKSGTLHLEGLEWEVLVVHDPECSACSSPGGTIVMFTEYLKRLSSDDEIAFVMGHEVAHILARHKAEEVSKFSWLIPIERFLGYFMPFCITEALVNLLMSPLEMRMEIEADYIGLLLMASAGYDPQIVWDGVNFRNAGLPWDSIERRIREFFLEDPEVRSEAIGIYRETIVSSITRALSKSPMFNDGFLTDHC